MPAGFEVYSASGVKLLGVADRLTRYLNMLYVTDDGSVAVPQASIGQVWYGVAPAAPFNTFRAFPRLSWSGSTLSWSYQAVNGAIKSPAYVVYGVM